MSFRIIATYSIFARKYWDKIYVFSHGVIFGDEKQSPSRIIFNAR